MSTLSWTQSHIAKEILSKISNCLIKNNRQQHVYFCVEKELPVSAIDVTVKNVGKFQLPLTKEFIEKLICNSTEAKFGIGNDSLLDKKVCDANEITADKLNVVINDVLFKRMLNEMRQELGIPEMTSLEPHLHNLLICGTGQFFENNRVDEHADGTIATLVVVLPVGHVGGDLIVEHNKEKHIFFSEDIDINNIKCAAFYADCNYKAKKVTQGHRIVLNYNLISSTKNTHYSHYSNLELEKLMQKYFNDEELIKMDFLKLTCFLDHSYTQHNLRWNMLKGTDIKTGSAMLNAAQKLNLVPHLVLVEILRTLTDDDSILRKRGLIDKCEKSNVTFWIDSNNEKLHYDKHTLTSKFICCSIKNKNFEPDFVEVKPDDEEFVIHIRYRRAAVVLYPISNDIRMKFIFNYSKEKKQFLEMLKVPGRQDSAKQIIMKAGKYLHDKESIKQKDIFVFFVDFAIKIHDRKVAFELLSYFSWALLDLDITVCLANLKSMYAISFVIELLQKWENEWGYMYLLNNICDTVINLVRFDVGVELVHFILEKQYLYLTKTHISLWEKHIEKIEELLKACELVRGFHPGTIQQALVDFTISTRIFSIECIIPLILDLEKNDMVVGTPWFAALKNYAVSKLTKEKLLSYKPGNDWSVLRFISCKCNYCLILQQFLLSKHKVKKILICPEKIKEHLERVIKRCEPDFIYICTEILGSCFAVVFLKTGLHSNSSYHFFRYNSYLLSLNT